MKAVFWFLVPIELSLAACGNSPARPTESNRPPITGEITPVINEIAAGHFLSPCDRAQLPKMLEIARAVDGHRTDLEADQSAEIDDKYRVVQMGPIRVRNSSSRCNRSPGGETIGIVGQLFRKILTRRFLTPRRRTGGC